MQIPLKAGQKFHKLTVVKLDHIVRKEYKFCRSKSGKRVLNLEYYLCRCECGKETIVEKSHLRKNVDYTDSCGCSSQKHGLRNTRLFRIWSGMCKRCNNKNCIDYKNYGGKGVKICDEWNEFINFYNWANANGYKENLTIDRINNNGNYEPTNCRWATKSEQSKNRKCVKKYLFNNQYLTLGEIAKIMNKKYSTLYMKIRRKGTI